MAKPITSFLEQSSSSGASSRTVSVTVSAGTEELVIAAMWTGQFSVTGVTVDGQAAAFVDGHTTGSGSAQRFIEYWRFTAPAPGTYDVIVSWSGSTRVTAAVWEATGLGASPFAELVTASPSSTTPHELPVTLDADQAAVCVLLTGFGNSRTITGTGGAQTNDFSIVANNSNRAGARLEESGTFSWTLSGTESGAIAALPLNGSSDQSSATITSPPDGASASTGTQITLEGSGTDEGDPVPGDRLQWSSDVDGLLGTGSPFGVILSDATHTLTLDTLDTDETTVLASDSVTFTQGASAGTTIITGGGDDMAAIQANEAAATRRRVYFRLLDATGAPADINVTGVTASLSINGAGTDPSTNDIVKVSGALGLYYVELTQAETDQTVGTVIVVAVAASGTLGAVTTALITGFAVAEAPPEEVGVTPTARGQIATESAGAILVTPANKLATDGTGRVTAGTVADKTGYTVATVQDKTGYALATTPPTAAQIRTEIEAGGTKLTNVEARLTAARAQKLDRDLSEKGDSMALTTAARNDVVDNIPLFPEITDGGGVNFRTRLNVVRATASGTVRDGFGRLLRFIGLSPS